MRPLCVRGARPDHGVSRCPSRPSRQAGRIGARPTAQPAARPALRRCSGQALAEFVVIALALVPLFLLIPVIGKYQGIGHAAELASRYVAFESIASNDGMAAYKAPSQLAQEVRRRFFSNTDAPIKTNDEAGDFKAHRNPGWVDPHGKALIRRFSDVSVSFGAGHGASHADARIAADDAAPFNVPSPIQVGDHLGLKSGLYRANVSVAVSNLEDAGASYASSYNILKDLNLTFTRHTVVLNDTWTARDAAQVEARIGDDALFPGIRLAHARPLVKAAVTMIESPGDIRVPRLGELDFWRDQVPADRLR